MYVMCVKDIGHKRVRRMQFAAAIANEHCVEMKTKMRDVSAYWLGLDKFLRHKTKTSAQRMGKREKRINASSSPIQHSPDERNRWNE